MEFDGLMPFVSGYPTTTVGIASDEFDLHNDGEFRELNIDLPHKSVRLVWRMKQAAWQTPGLNETWERRTVAGLSLIFTEVSLVSVAGIIPGSLGADDLDFLEYSAFAGQLGETRIVFGNTSEARIVAGKFRLQLME